MPLPNPPIACNICGAKVQLGQIWDHYRSWHGLFTEDAEGRGGIDG